MFVFKVGVVGAGAAGEELAQAVEKAGVPVARCEPGDLGGLGDADLVLVGAPGDAETAEALLAEVDAAAPGHALLLVDTARLSVSELAAATTRPELVAGVRLRAGSRLLELVEGDDTSPEAVQAILRFAGTIRRTVARSLESPGAIVDRLLGALAAEAVRHQEATGEDAEAIDAAVTGARLAAVGPFAMAREGGDEAARDLQVHYGDRFHVAGDVRSDPRVEGELVDRLRLRVLVEACLLVEEGVTGVRDVDTAMAAGAGMVPGPFAAADAQGLDAALAALQALEGQLGEAYAPPVLLRRLVAQGRLGKAAGQGVLAYARPDAGTDEGPVVLEHRGDVAIAWLDNPPANSISAAVVAGLERAWEAVESGERPARALVIASANPALFCAGADIRAFAEMDRDACAMLLRDMHRLLRRMEQSRVVTVAAVNGLALGGGCELAMGCDIRIAAASATFGQPEIALGIIPGFGGTQRLARLVGQGKAIEMQLDGRPVTADDALAHGLVHRVVADHELLDVAVAWARGLGRQAPVAVEQIKQVTGTSDHESGLAAEQQAFLAAFASEDATEGIGAFLAKRAPQWRGI